MRWRGGEGARELVSVSHRVVLTVGSNRGLAL